ncbi:MAG: helix-turn-helix transcriptional regulator [Rickettsiales bacterium]|nr:helix-turn-helix transcriptional regulator [Pseudomonadota bacterium]MDA0965610.1 helix-turn-helix transcriptional regulator [Pseudomonadota bacterium]MDG4542934.1 helix-turn-helix transcriptional regulator [Rickettsiales bacterium]MDG4544618.1 helix-turn-helix transcriptional regulator [Rickettsiales bacterium]MDG4546740.1 helix-turn-helix transcriptional regulator [Rickettsiales bacterium]
MSDLLLNDIDKYIGKRLRLSRNSIGMTQQELAEKIGVTFQQLQKYETGLNRVGGSRLYQICKILNVDPNYFFEEILLKKNTVDSTCDNNIEDQALLSLIKNFKKISSPELRSVVLDLSKIIANNAKYKK